MIPFVDFKRENEEIGERAKQYQNTYTVNVVRFSRRLYHDRVQKKLDKNRHLVYMRLKDFVNFVEVFCCLTR